MITGYSNTISVTTSAPSLLLDLYPSAAVAYSVRKLRTAYTGSAIQVRRSSDNLTQNIGFDAFGNLDTSSLTSFCSGTNGFVTTWYDQSGNSIDATQSTAARQPQIVSSGSVINLNSKPSLFFNGGNGFATSLAISQPFNFFGVLKATNPSDIIYDYNGSGNRSYLFASPTWLIDSGSALVSSSSTQNQGLFNALHNSTSSNIRINGSSTASGNAGTRGINGMIIATNNFAGTFLDGDIQEFIMYASNKSSSNTGIESNINTYYGIY